LTASVVSKAGKKETCLLIGLKVLGLGSWSISVEEKDELKLGIFFGIRWKNKTVALLPVRDRK
jgi:hypothetical protein